MKLNLEEQEETIEPVEKTDLIYGIDDRPPFKEALFAALQHLLAIFVAIITPPLIIAGALKLDLETTVSGFDGTLCIWRLDIHTVSPDWSGRGEVALYPRNEFFFHRSDHNGRTGRRIAPYIRGVYCGSPDRDGNQPDIQVYAFYHNSTGIGHRGAADRT